MINRDKRKFAALVDATAKMIGIPIWHEDQVKLFFNALSDWSTQEVREALSYYLQTTKVRKMPMLSDFTRFKECKAACQGNPFTAEEDNWGVLTPFDASLTHGELKHDVFGESTRQISRPIPRLIENTAGI